MFKKNKKQTETIKEPKEKKVHTGDGMGKQVAARLKQNNFNIPNGGVAQLGEHLPCKQGVKSSNLSISIHWRIQCKS